jgi:hypothetical protein
MYIWQYFLSFPSFQKQKEKCVFHIFLLLNKLALIEVSEITFKYCAVAA